MKKLIKLWLSVFVICFLSKTLSLGQIMPHLGWYQDAQLFYNPSYAGTGDELRGVMIHRGQWKGIPGSPVTNYIAFDKPLGKGIGAGFTLSRDAIGKTIENKLSLDGSYRVYMNSKSFFQGGIKVSVSYLSSKYSQLSSWDADDELQVDIATYIPRIGFGLTYKTPKFYVGFSAPDFFSYDTKRVLANESDNKFMRKNYFLMGGTKFSVSEYVSFVPTVTFRYYEKRGLNYTLNAGLELNQTILVGLSYVHPSIYGAYGKVALTPRIKFGYRHEFSPSVISVGTFGTGEFLLTYGFR